MPQSPTLLEWLAPFQGANLEASLDLAAILASTDEEGWPHHAYLSAGEILARVSGLSVALWKNSGSAANIRRRGRALLCVAGQGCIWEARLRLREREGEQENICIFDGEILDTRRNAAPYAEVISLLDFRLHDPAATLDRWRKQHDLLRGA